MIVFAHFLTKYLTISIERKDGCFGISKLSLLIKYFDAALKLNILIFVFISLLICILVILNTNEISAADREKERSWFDIAYANFSARQKLDICLPSVGKGPFPVVIWIHGGGFAGGSKQDPETALNLRSKTYLKNAGFAVVSINYRLSSEAKWPAQLEDMKNVVLFIRENASKYFLNPEKIGAWGASAGGHLAAMMGVALAKDEKTRIQACVVWFGPTDFFNMDADMTLSGVSPKRGPMGAANSPVSVLLGVQVSTHKAESDNASPVVKVNALDNNTLMPQFLIMHGGKDSTIGANQSLRLHNAIISKFGSEKSTYLFLPNGTHGGGDFELPSTEKLVIDFFISKLK
jgi:acetyl esterase/lipase